MSNGIENKTFLKYFAIISVATEITHVDQVLDSKIIRDLKNKAMAWGASKDLWVVCVLKQIEKK